MADIKKFNSPSNFGGGKKYLMHTDSPDVRRASREDEEYMPHKNPGEWAEKHEHPEGVTEHVHEEGSSLFVTHAGSAKEANRRIGAAAERSNKRIKGEVTERYGYDPVGSGAPALYNNPKFAFRPENKGTVKPTVIKGGKDDS